MTSDEFLQSLYTRQHSASEDVPNLELMAIVETLTKYAFYDIAVKVEALLTRNDGPDFVNAIHEALEMAKANRLEVNRCLRVNQSKGTEIAGYYCPVGEDAFTPDGLHVRQLTAWCPLMFIEPLNKPMKTGITGFALVLGISTPYWNDKRQLVQDFYYRASNEFRPGQTSEGFRLNSWQWLTEKPEDHEEE